MCNHHHHHHTENANRTLFVIVLTLITMVAEIAYGFFTNSMALLSDGWHMGVHALALGVTFLTYIFISKIKENKNAHLVGEKISSLGGYTSSLFLFITSLWIIFESVMRFINPLKIQFNEAILVAVIGFLVNLVCIFIMEFKNDNKNKDYNFKAAYLHILTDVMTSISAIIALIAGKYFGLIFLDSIIGIVAGLVILKWSIDLIKNTSSVLLDWDLMKK